MPKLTSSLPKYRKHRASGQAIAAMNCFQIAGAVIPHARTRPSPNSANPARSAPNQLQPVGSGGFVQNG